MLTQLLPLANTFLPLISICIGAERGPLGHPASYILHPSFRISFERRKPSFRSTLSAPATLKVYIGCVPYPLGYQSSGSVTVSLNSSICFSPTKRSSEATVEPSGAIMDAVNESGE